ncbi:MAG: hypothetical protein H6Q76_1936 [Firmicutes bacterium]|nr:hypothetical protein [Bacillota bacterium]
MGAGSAVAERVLIKSRGMLKKYELWVNFVLF